PGPTIPVVPKLPPHDLLHAPPPFQW
ncbi:hypothetical protein A2U01_0115491, partial [Trifolium medium]|nr:hypothetical protein [Trifolium medium]